MHRFHMHRSPFAFELVLSSLLSLLACPPHPSCQQATIIMADLSSEPSAKKARVEETSAVVPTAAAAAAPLVAAQGKPNAAFRVQFGPGALGLELRYLADGTIGVIGFTESTSPEAMLALKTGDRICAVGKNPVPPFTPLEKAALFITSSVREFLCCSIHL